MGKTLLSSIGQGGLKGQQIPPLLRPPITGLLRKFGGDADTLGIVGHLQWTLICSLLDKKFAVCISVGTSRRCFGPCGGDSFFLLKTEEDKDIDIQVNRGWDEFRTNPGMCG